MDEEVRITLRLPASLRDLVSKSAEESGRSLNSQLVYLIQKSLVSENKVIELDGYVSELWKDMEEMKEKMRVLWAVYNKQDPDNREW